MPPGRRGFKAPLFVGIRNLVWVSGFMAVVALISKGGF